ncbi:DNA polymerase [Arthrobacter sp. Hiyo4]|nr:DNA polymerase [Arthrobacter sp. Hiyo4]
MAVTRAELASRTLDPKTLKPVLTILIGPDSDVGRAMSGRRYLRPRTLFKSWLDAMPPRTLVAEVVSQLTAPERP